MVPIRGDIAGFFPEFAPGGGDRRFARIELAGRQLEKMVVQWIAELPLQQDAPVVENRQDHGRARVHHVLPPCLTTVGQSHLVFAHFEQAAPIGHPGADCRFGEVGVRYRRDAHSELWIAYWHTDINQPGTIPTTSVAMPFRLSNRRALV